MTELTPAERAEYVRQLENQQTNRNLEQAHYSADEILCTILQRLGYTDIVLAWDEVGKWYV